MADDISSGQFSFPSHWRLIADDALGDVCIQSAKRNFLVYLLDLWVLSVDRNSPKEWIPFSSLVIIAVPQLPTENDNVQHRTFYGTCCSQYWWQSDSCYPVILWNSIIHSNVCSFFLSRVIEKLPALFLPSCSTRPLHGKKIEFSSPTPLFRTCCAIWIPG